MVCGNRLSCFFLFVVDSWHYTLVCVMGGGLKGRFVRCLVNDFMDWQRRYEHSNAYSIYIFSLVYALSHVAFVVICFPRIYCPICIIHI